MAEIKIVILIHPFSKNLYMSSILYYSNYCPHSKELIGLFSNLYPSNKEYIKTRYYYRIYLFIYMMLFLFYLYIDEINSFI